MIKTAVKAIAKPKFIYHIESVTPATTMVDECNKEETGVGLSIAMGNQYDKIQIADLPKNSNKTEDPIPGNSNYQHHEEKITQSIIQYRGHRGG